MCIPLNSTYDDDFADFADCDDSGVRDHEVPPDLDDEYEGFLEAFAQFIRRPWLTEGACLTLS